MLLQNNIVLMHFTLKYAFSLMEVIYAYLKVPIYKPFTILHRINILITFNRYVTVILHYLCKYFLMNWTNMNLEVLYYFGNYSISISFQHLTFKGTVIFEFNTWLIFGKCRYIRICICMYIVPVNLVIFLDKVINETSIIN